jgi:capsular exopolysaccharide synthesis family protein
VSQAISQPAPGKGLEAFSWVDILMAQNLRQIENDIDGQHARPHVDVLGVAWRHKWLVLLGLGVSLVLAAFHYAMRTPVYKSTAQVLVIKKRPETVPLMGGDSGFSYYEDYLATHVVLIKSPLIVSRAVRKCPELGALTSFGGSVDPTYAIIGGLAVTRDSKDNNVFNSNNILNLSYRGQVANECGTILNAVIAGYKDFLEETYKNVSDDTLKLITEARNVLRDDLGKKEKEYRKFKETAPLLWRGKDAANPYLEKFANIESKRATLLVRQLELQGRLTGIEKALKEGRSREALVAILPESPALASAEATRRGSAVGAQDQLLPLLLNEQELLQDLGPNHPQVQSVKRRIELNRKYLANPIQAWTDTATAPDKGGDGSRLDPMEVYVQSLKQELENIRISEELLAKRSEEEYATTRTLTKAEIQDENFRNDIARTQQLYDGIVKRLTEVSLIQQYGGYDARTVFEAGEGGLVEPTPTPIFMSALLLGLLGGFGLAFVADRTDKNFRSSEEIRRRLGLPIVGHIPLLEPAEAALEDTSPAPLHSLLWAYYRPQSAEAECYRGVRTALCFSMEDKQQRVIQVTSPNMGDGKTTLVANLGISIAQMGRSVLLIDADLRRPRLHHVFGLSADLGLTSVIQGSAELNDAIQESRIPGLSILPSGPVSPNPAELLISPRFKELMGAIGTKYDFVLVDTPPLLAVTDPCVVAPCVNAVLLNIRVSKNARPNAERAKEILSTLGITVLGVVINGVSAGGGASAYGSYYRRQGYGYANGYHSNRGPDGAGNRIADATGTEAPKHHGQDELRPGDMVPSAGQARPRRNGDPSPNAARVGFLRRLFGLR